MTATLASAAAFATYTDCRGRTSRAGFSVVYCDSALCSAMTATFASVAAFANTQIAVAAPTMLGHQLQQSVCQAWHLPAHCLAVTAASALPAAFATHRLPQPRVLCCPWYWPSCFSNLNDAFND
jgi:hypothetical protein